MSSLTQTTRQTCMSGQALLPHWLCNQKHPWGLCSCSPMVNFLKVTFYHGMVTLVIFLIKNLNRHIKHENLLSIYENMDYFQIMLFTVTCWKFQKIQQPYIKRYCYVFFSTNIVEILLKLWADASSIFTGIIITITITIIIIIVLYICATTKRFG